MKTFESILKLVKRFVPTPEQLAIFKWFFSPKGHLIIKAGAGTGKTSTGTAAISFVPRGTKGLFTTFAAPAAKDIQAKLSEAGISWRDFEGKSTHALGRRMVEYYSNMVPKNGGRVGKVKVDEDDVTGWNFAAAAMPANAPNDQVALVAKLAAMGKNVAPFAKIADLVDVAWKYRILPDDEDNEAGTFTVEKLATAAHGAMELAKSRTNLMVDGLSFNDMLWLPVVNNWIRPWFNMVVVDEAQDMNPTQLILVQRALKRGGNMVYIGDMNQRMYNFRGADVDGMPRFEREMNATSLTLSVTFRCAKMIVKDANRMVPAYYAHESNPDGEVALTYIDEQGKTKRYDTERMLEELKPSDFVLSRTNAPLARHCLALLKQGRRAIIQGRDIGATLISLIKKVAKVKKNDQLAGVPVDTFLDMLKLWVEREIAKAHKKAKTPQQAENRCEYVVDQAETLEALSEDVETMLHVVERLASIFDEANGDEPIVLSTIHRAKGLERDTVYLLQDTLFSGPLKNADGHLTEESCIEYVAVTRAKSRLVKIGDKKERPAFGQA